jgi:hypothetical protein
LLSAEASLNELALLAETAGLEVVGQEIQNWITHILHIYRTWESRRNSLFIRRITSRGSNL